MIADSHFALTLKHQLGDTPETRRVSVRSDFAFVEGITHALKRFARECYKDAAPIFTLQDIQTLREESRFPPFKENVKLAFRTFRTAAGIEGATDYSGPGWKSLLDAAEVRNRLMHPKQAADLEVLDDEMDTVGLGVTWFSKEALRLVQPKP